MSGFKLHNRGNPCPVCQAIKDCRTVVDTGMVLCHSHIDYDPDIAGWKYLGAANNPVWGRFVRDDSNGTFDREAWLRREEEKKQKRKQTLKKTLDRDSRNYAIRELHKQIGLSRKDRTQLKRRGLNDNQIDKGLFFSKTQDGDIPRYIPPNLPGIDPYNHKLRGDYEGIICPAFDYQGRAISWQTRLENAEENKYRWAYQPELPNGEKPITLVRQNPQDKTLYIAEGFLKPYVAANIHNLNFVGAPGGYFNNSPQQIQEILSLGFEQLVICPDAGDTINRHTSLRWRKQIQFFKQFGLEIKVAWWEQISKENHADIDELENLDGLKLITTEEFVKKSTNRETTCGEPKRLCAFSFTGFLKKYIPKHLRKKLCKEEKVVYFGKDELPKFGEDVPIKVIFSEAQRQEAIAACQLAGWKHILDTSIPGTGKSHDMGLTDNKYGKVWLANKEHRNPTTKTVEENFKDLSTRHNGLNYDETRYTPLGKPFQRTTSDWKNADIKGLCKNAKLFHSIAAKGYQQKEEEEKHNAICRNCEHFTDKRTDKNGNVLPKCAAATGDGFGYLHERGKGLLQNKISCSINSLPSPNDHNYASDLLMVDEADTEVEGTNTIKVRIHHIDKSLIRLSKCFPSKFLELRAIIDKIYCYLDGSKPQPYYGFERQEILDLLGEPPENLEELIQACEIVTPKVKDLVTPREDGLYVKGFERKIRHLAAAANEEYRREAEAETKRKIRELEPNWLVDFLCIWAGLIPGTLRIRGNKLEVTTRSDRHGEVVRKTGLTLLSDATANKDKIAYKLGIHPNALIQIEQEKPDFSNLTVYAIETPGIGSNKPSELAQKRVGILLDILKARFGEMPVIGHKNMHYDHYWFNDTRGVNHFDGQEQLALVGTPRLNIGAARDEFFTLHGSYDGFSEYYQSLTEAEQLQGIFRQRSHRYPDCQFKLFLIGTNLNLEFLEEMGINLIYFHATEFCPQAGTKGELTKFAMGQKLKTFIRLGEKNITQEAIAQSIGRSQATVSNWFKTLEGGYLTLKHEILDLISDPSNSKTNKIIEDKINRWIATNPIEATKEVVDELVIHGWHDFKQYFLSQFCLDHQMRFLGLLLNLLLTDKEKQEIFSDFYPPPT